jgi:hypothetical protein
LGSFFQVRFFRFNHKFLGFGYFSLFQVFLSFALSSMQNGKLKVFLLIHDIFIFFKSISISDLWRLKKHIWRKVENCLEVYWCSGLFGRQTINENEECHIIRLILLTFAAWDISFAPEMHVIGNKKYTCQIPDWNSTYMYL